MRVRDLVMRSFCVDSLVRPPTEKGFDRHFLRFWVPGGRHDLISLSSELRWDVDACLSEIGLEAWRGIDSLPVP